MLSTHKIPNRKGTLMSSGRLINPFNANALTLDDIFAEDYLTYWPPTRLDIPPKHCKVVMPHSEPEFTHDEEPAVTIAHVTYKGDKEVIDPQLERVPAYVVGLAPDTKGQWHAVATHTIDRSGKK